MLRVTSYSSASRQEHIKLFAWDQVNPDEVLYDPDFTKPFESSAATGKISDGSKAPDRQ